MANENGRLVVNIIIIALPLISLGIEKKTYVQTLLSYSSDVSKAWFLRAIMQYRIRGQ